LSNFAIKNHFFLQVSIDLSELSLCPTHN